MAENELYRQLFDTTNDAILILRDEEIGDGNLSAAALFDGDLAQLVELRYFAGLTVPEIAEVEGKSVSTVERSWRLARAWLRKQLGDPDERGSR